MKSSFIILDNDSGLLLAGLAMQFKIWKGQFDPKSHFVLAGVSLPVRYQG